MGVSLIGREKEVAWLEKYEKSGKAEFIAIYGRRRVGKTFLVRQHFKGRIAFEISGALGESRQAQLNNFLQELKRKTNEPQPRLATWQDAFFSLEQYIDRLETTTKGRIILFFDELPWLDTPKSGFTRAFDYFWNHYASAHERVMLIVCGSATSWMVNTLINDRGGLHNRITREIHLRPFTLHETELYMKHRGFKWNRLTIAQAYMILGGTPYYLDMLVPDEPLPTNIDRLAFADNAPLRSEYQRLFSSLFGDSEKYMRVINLLSKHGKGLTREEIVAKLGIATGGGISRVLSDLENCDFLRYYFIGSKTRKVNGGIYQLTDFFTLFHFTFIAKRNTSPTYWSEMYLSPKIVTWNGLAFERLCLSRIELIKKALHIDTIHTDYYSWRNKSSDNGGAQIDLLIERADGMTNICEMKYSQSIYSFSKAEADKLRRRVELFRQETSTRNGLTTTLVTTFGLDRNANSDCIDTIVTLDQLFD